MWWDVAVDVAVVVVVVVVLLIQVRLGFGLVRLTILHELLRQPRNAPSTKTPGRRREKQGGAVVCVGVVLGRPSPAMTLALALAVALAVAMAVAVAVAVATHPRYHANIPGSAPGNTSGMRAGEGSEVPWWSVYV